jgi:SH3-like domain-containing protein
MKPMRFLIFSAVILCLWAQTSIGAERLAVAVDTANIRSGPGANYEQLWQVEKYHPLLILQKKGDWYEFKDFEGDRGWIQRDLVDTTETVIVKVNQCHVRSGPGTQFDVVFTVDKGVPFKVLQKKDRWYEVQHADGDHGWIFNALVW